MSKELKEILYGLLIMAGIFLCLFAIASVKSYYKSKRVEILVVQSISDYTEEKADKGSEWHYVNVSGQPKTIELTANYYVCNQTDSTLRLYSVDYARFYKGLPPNSEKTLLLIEPHSTVSIGSYPDYILTPPPSTITTRSKGASWENQTESRTILEIYKRK